MKITIFLILFTTSLFSQEIRFVNAPSGLIVRDNPNKNSTRIGKIENEKRVHILTKTGINLSIPDGDKNVIGEWIEVKEVKGNQKGYVFGGFLTDIIPNKGVVKGNYYLTKIDSITEKRYWEDFQKNIKTKPLFIYLRNKKHSNLVELEIGDLEFYDGTTISINKKSELKDIIEIIKVESSYSACCSNTDEYYYLIDKNNQLINLTKIENNHCDGPEPYFTYLFPSDTNGKKDKIIYAKIIPQDNAEDKIEVINTFSWNSIELTLEN